MPKFLEDRLEKQAAKKGFSGDRADAYVFGTMNKIGAMHGNKETPKGRSMEKAHDRMAAHFNSHRKAKKG